MPSSEVLKFAVMNLNSQSLVNNDTLSTNSREVNVLEHLFPLLPQAMGYAYEIVPAYSGGILLSDGNWTGAIGLVNRSEVDIAVAHLIMTEERNEAVSFSFPINLGDITFVTRNPEFSPDPFAVFHLVTATFGLLLATFMLVMSISVYFLFERTRPISYVTFAVVASTLGQAFLLKPRQLGQQLLVLFWIIGMTIFAKCYQSILLSHLTLPPLEGIRDISELVAAVQKGEYQCTTAEASSLPHMLLNSSSAANKIIGNNILENPMRKGFLKAFLKHSDAKTAYLGPRDAISFLSGMYFVSKDSFFHTLMGFAVRKDFCCKENLNLIVLRILEAGIYKKIVREYHFRTTLSKIPSASESKSSNKLSLIDVTSPFLILLFGYCVGLLILVIEILAHKL